VSSLQPDIVILGVARCLGLFRPAVLVSAGLLPVDGVAAVYRRLHGPWSRFGSAACPVPGGGRAGALDDDT